MNLAPWFLNDHGLRTTVRIFNQINAALANIKDFFQNINKKIWILPNFWPVVYVLQIWHNTVYCLHIFRFDFCRSCCWSSWADRLKIVQTSFMMLLVLGKMCQHGRADKALTASRALHSIVFVLLNEIRSDMPHYPNNKTQFKTIDCKSGFLSSTPSAIWN